MSTIGQYTHGAKHYQCRLVESWCQRLWIQGHVGNELGPRHEYSGHSHGTTRNDVWYSWDITNIASSVTPFTTRHMIIIIVAGHSCMPIRIAMMAVLVIPNVWMGILPNWNKGGAERFNNKSSSLPTSRQRKTKRFSKKTCKLYIGHSQAVVAFL